MLTSHYRTLDGNEAVASIAYRLSEIVAIDPITPASPMGEYADDWSAINASWWVMEILAMHKEVGPAPRGPT